MRKQIFAIIVAFLFGTTATQAQVTLTLEQYNEYQGYKKELDNLKITSANSLATIQQLSNENVELKQQVNNLKASNDNNKLKDELKILKAELKQNEAEIKKLNDSQKQYNEIATELKLCKNSEKANAATLQSFNKKEQQLNELTTKVNNLTNQLLAKDKELFELGKKNKEFVELKREEIDELIAQNNELVVGQIMEANNPQLVNQLNKTKKFLLTFPTELALKNSHDKLVQFENLCKLIESSNEVLMSKYDVNKNNNILQQLKSASPSLSQKPTFDAYINILNDYCKKVYKVQSDTDYMMQMIASEKGKKNAIEITMSKIDKNHYPYLYIELEKLLSNPKGLTVNPFQKISNCP